MFMFADREGRVGSAALYGAPSEPECARGPSGPFHGGGGGSSSADDWVAERRTHAAGQRRRPVPYRDGRRPVVAAHRRGQARRQRLVSVYCGQCRGNGHQPSSPCCTGYSNFVIIIIIIIIVVVVVLFYVVVVIIIIIIITVIVSLLFLLLHHNDATSPNTSIS